MAEKKTTEVSPRLARILAARKKLTAMLAAGHPNSKVIKQRLAEYDESEKKLRAPA